MDWRRLIPCRVALLANRWLRWLAPWLGHPRLWHWSRRGRALGVALGVFFGLLIPFAQIPLAAAVVLRTNPPAAAARTLISNPVTFASLLHGLPLGCVGYWRNGHTVRGCRNERCGGGKQDYAATHDSARQTAWSRFVDRGLHFTGEAVLVASEEFVGAALKRLDAPTILYPIRSAADQAVEALTAIIRHNEAAK